MTRYYNNKKIKLIHDNGIGLCGQCIFETIGHKCPQKDHKFLCISIIKNNKYQSLCWVYEKSIEKIEII